MTDVLRPDLYARLKLKFGKVLIANQGQNISWAIEIGNEGKPRRILDSSREHHWGESYRVNCPYCGDTKRRLYVGHMWGLKDEVTGQQNLWLAFCQNENCLKLYEQQKAFYSHVWDFTTPGSDVVIKHRDKKSTGGVLEWPGGVWLLGSLPPDHRARQYLTERRFNADFLSTYFRVGYIWEASFDFRFLNGRLMIPIFLEGKIVGWQARLIYKEPDEHNPKYFTGNGTPRARLLYNFENAKKYPYCVVVEGPTDVWRFGPEAVAVFGKPSGMQASIIQANWKTAIILLDEDAAKESKDLFEVLRKTMKVLEVSLPVGVDPGDFHDTPSLREFVFKQLAEKGFDPKEPT
jgi:hypothetical protein